VATTKIELDKALWTEVQAHAIEFKRPMLNPADFIAVSLLCFAIWGFYAWRLNSLGIERDADSPENTPAWIKRFENISGPGVLFILLGLGFIDFPGKRSLERRLLRQPHVLSSVNKMRGRFGKPPILTEDPVVNSGS